MRVQLNSQFINRTTMKRLIFTLAFAVCAYSNLSSQHEIKANIGRSYSNSYNFTSYVNTLEYNEFRTESNKSIQLGASYGYYVKCNLKLFAEMSYQQKGYESWLIDRYGTVVSDYRYVYQYDFLNTTVGVAYYTDFGAYASFGLTSSSLLSATRDLTTRVHYETDPMSSEASVSSVDLYGDCYTGYIVPTMGIGYQMGDLSIELSHTRIGSYGYYGESDFYFFDPYGLNSVSLLVGYSKLIIR